MFKQPFKFYIQGYLWVMGVASAVCAAAIALSVVTDHFNPAGRDNRRLAAWGLILVANTVSCFNCIEPAGKLFDEDE